MQQEEVVRMLPACGSGQPLLAAALAVDAGAAALTVSGPEPAAPTMWERLLRGGRTRRKLDATSSSDASGAYLHDSAGKRMAHTCAAGLPTAVAAGDGARQQQRIAQIRPARAQPRQQAALAGRPGETDLSLGAAVVYCPTAFSAAESRALYESLKVRNAMLLPFSQGSSCFIALRAVSACACLRAACGALRREGRDGRSGR